MSTEIATLAQRADALRTFFEERKPMLNMALARAGITADRIVQALFIAGQKTPDLFRCTPQSVYKAMLLSAQSGLIADGVTQKAHLIPRKNKKGELECNLQLGYRGLLDLCRRSEAVTVIKGVVVRKGDHFKRFEGTVNRIEHEALDDIYESDGKTERKVTHAYAVAFFKNGAIDFEVMPVSEIEALRERSRARSDAWNTDYAEMCKKTVLRRLCKRLPQSEDVARLIEIDAQAEAGIPQGLGDDDFVDAEVVETPPAEAPPPPKPEPRKAAKRAPEPPPVVEEDFLPPEELDEEGPRSSGPPTPDNETRGADQGTFQTMFG